MTRPVRQGRVLVRWLRRENDFMIDSPDKWDGGYVHDRLLKHQPIDMMKVLKLIEDGMTPLQAMHEAKEPSFIEELEARGYDPKSLYFHIDQKKLGG